MWILISVASERMILVSNWINMNSGQHNNHLVNDTPPMEITICRLEPILQLFIQFGFEY